MKTKPLIFLLALTFLFLFSCSDSGDDFQDGLDAYQKQDYKTAHRLWLPLAEQGKAIAQNNLGVMYANGDGVGRSTSRKKSDFRQNLALCCHFSYRCFGIDVIQCRQYLQ